MTSFDENARDSYHQRRGDMSAIPVPGINNKMTHIHNGYVDDDDDDDENTTASSKRCCGCCRKKQRPGPKVPKVSQKKKCVNCCRKFITFLLSHIGLTCLVAGYSLLGGYIFMTLESPFEIIQRSKVGTIRQLAVDRLWNYTESLNILNKDHWKQSVNGKLKDFQLEVFKAVREGGWDGSDGTNTVELQWSFTGALLYSVTVITTIGYGHIAPKTVAGRLVTIAYAMVGIPLMLLCLANVGNILASCFRVFYTQVLCCMCCDKKKTNGDTPVSAVRTEIAPPFIRHPRDSGMENGESVYGNFIEGGALPHQSAVICTLEGDERPVTIPVIVTLLFMTGYILCGTLLFTTWEDNWDYIEGSYFCFITLSTIGFGDFVPGTSINTWNNEGKQVMCTLYLLFGLATVAMCFELLQAQVRETCRTIGERIGIL